jgi:hypothetical protein
VSRCLRVYENKGKSGIFLWCNKYREIKLICNLLEDFNINISQKINKENLTISNYLNKVIFDNDEIETDIIEQIQDNIIINTENQNYIDLINFIKKYSSISNTFLEDFFSINNYNDFSNNFIINLDIVSKLLEVHKGNIKNTLIKSYKKNIDYTVERIKKGKGTGRGATTKEKILLTPICFKKICQLTKSKKGDEVRELYHMIRVFIIADCFQDGHLKNPTTPSSYSTIL